MEEDLRHEKMRTKTEMLLFDAGIAAASITVSRDHATCMVWFEGRGRYRSIAGAGASSLMTKQIDRHF